MSKKKKSQITKTQVKQMLASLAFDPDEKPASFVFAANNPHYAYSRALENLEDSDVLESPTTASEPIRRAIQMLVSALLMLEASNGAKEPENEA